MKASLGGVVQCEACTLMFSCLPTFYVACNDPSETPTDCRHEGLALAVYDVECPSCGTRCEATEPFGPGNGRQEWTR